MLEVKLSRFSSVLSRYFPNWFTRRLVRKLGTSSENIDLADELFRGKELDIKPRNTGRGFMLIVDKHFSLWFRQDGDHFIYDGWEAGEYSRGDVTLFDAMRRSKLELCDKELEQEVVDCE